MTGCKILDRRLYAARKIIFHEGDTANGAFIVESGSVEIFRRVGDREIVLAELGVGEIFGEMAFIDDKTRSASARAINVTTLQRVTEASLEKLKEVTPGAVWALLCVSLSRLRDANAKLAAISLDIPEHDQMGRIGRD
jgi:CRP-like cAMP-binding protein